MSEEAKGFFSNETAEAIDRLTQEIKTGLEWFKSHSGLATKLDLAETEKRILDAIGGGTPGLAQTLADLNAKLKGPTDALDAAVKAAPPA